MPENEFGLMKLLEKLVAERGGGAEVKGDELRDLKKTLGAQFTEAEAQKQGLLDDAWIVDPNVINTNIAMDSSQQTGASQTSAEIDQAFGKALGELPEWQQSNIIQVMQRMDSPEQVQNFKMQFLQGNIPSYQLENMQPPEANLGFGGDQVAQGSQFYNPALDIFMPDSYQGGYSGRTGDERYKQGTAGWGFDSYPHSKSRNVYNEQMMNPRYFPLKLG